MRNCRPPGNAPHGAVKVVGPQASAAALMAPAEVPVMMGKRLGSPAPQAMAQVGNRLQHPHLVGRAGAATGQQQSRWAGRMGALGAAGHGLVRVIRKSHRGRCAAAASKAESVRLGCSPQALGKPATLARGAAVCQPSNSTASANPLGW